MRMNVASVSALFNPASVKSEVASFDQARASSADGKLTLQFAGGQGALTTLSLGAGHPPALLLHSRL